MKVSMNDIIKVKLNKIGDELLQKVFGNSQELPKKDPDGYTEMKFLYLLKMFEDFEYLGEVNKPFDGGYRNRIISFHGTCLITCTTTTSRVALK